MTARSMKEASKLQERKKTARVAKKKSVQQETLRGPDLEWFRHDRFGLFIHWGLYALPARHEWVKNYERIPDAQYQQYFERFDPDLYDPAAWARAARLAGMKYVCVTTKHHEGFCLWDSRETDYKAPNTPAKRDLIRPLVDAFRAEGLRVGFYYSLIDWHHSEFRVDSLHPQRDDAAFREANQGRKQEKYTRYLHRQVKELLTQYGKIDYLFFDFSYPGPDGKGRADWDSERLLRMVRKLQPGIIVNDRLDLADTPGGWDVKTPEQCVLRQAPVQAGRPVAWETCQTLSGAWGYHRDEASWKSVRQLLVILLESVGKGGNLLLNVGPTARGEFDARALERLDGVGRWMRLHARSIYGCTQAPEEFAPPRNCLLTYNPAAKRLYVHLLDWPYQEIHLDGFAGKVAYAQLLNDGSELGMQGGREAWMVKENAEGTLSLKLPVPKPEVEIPVIELFLKD